MLKRIAQNVGFVARRPRVALRAGKSYLRKLAGKSVLRTIDIDLTYRCPCKCVQCYSDNFQDDDASELQVEEVAAVVSSAIPLGALQVALSGGEPLLRKDLPQIIAACQPHRTLVSLCTSGVGLNAKRVQNLKDAGLAVLVFSLDSLDAEVHNANRGVPGLQEKVIAAGREARRLGLQVIFNSVATREKLKNGELWGLAVFAREQGMILNLTVPAPLGRWTDNRDEILDSEERKLFFDLLEDPFVRTDTHSAYLRAGCPAGHEKISINAYGEVRACQILPRAFGNIRKDNLATIWQRIRAHPGLGEFAAFCPAGDADFIDANPDLFRPREISPLIQVQRR